MCRWSYATQFQFRSAKGRAVGSSYASAAGAAQVRTVPIGDTFQVVQSLSTMEGVRCSARPVSELTVSTPHAARLVVHLPRSLDICTGGRTDWTKLAAPRFPSPAPCAASDLKVSLGRASGAATATKYLIRFTNVSASTCVVAGTPNVQPTTGARSGDPRASVGPPSLIENRPGSGYGDPVRLTPLAQASASWIENDVNTYAAASCDAVSAQGLLVGLGATSSWFVPFASVVCGKVASTQTSGLAPAAVGLFA